MYEIYGTPVVCDGKYGCGKYVVWHGKYVVWQCDSVTGTDSLTDSLTPAF